MSSISVVGRIGYHAGDEGTVSLGAEEKLIGLYCVATGTGATLTIDGGDEIPLVPGIPFSMGLESMGAEWVGVELVFDGTAAYFVKTKSPLRT